MTKLILVRHGHVEGISPERFRGRVDLPLTDTGRRQAALTARRIASSVRPAAIYTSPMSRCIVTGAAIGSKVGVTPKPHPRLNDIDYGAWQGLTPAEARSSWRDEVETWYRTPHLAVIPGGESLQTMLARLADALHELLKRHPHDVIVLVGHDSVNRVLLLHALDLPLSRYWHLKQDPCAISEVEFGDGVFTIHSINETWHLKSEPSAA